MSTTLKKITTKAKQLYKSGKFLKWTDAIKAASATISKTTKKAVKKTVTKRSLKPASKKVKNTSKEYLVVKANNNNYLVDLKDKFFSPNIESAENFTKTQADSIVKKIKGTYSYKIGSIKKKVGYSEDRMNDMKEITRLSKNYHGMTKQGKTDRAAAFYYNRKKEGRLGATKTGTKKHTDTKSHNTSITVVSGINKTKLELAEELKTTLRDLANSQAMYKMLKERYKTTPKEWKVEVRYAIHQQKGRIAYLKNNLTRLKALIK